MYIQIVLQSPDKQAVLPINYQYPLAAWIYKTLERGNPKISEFLHQEGYVDGHRRFKFYSFSELRTPGAKVRGDRLILTQPEVTLSIRFLANQAAQSMINGLFQESAPLSIGDQISRGQFRIQSLKMEMLPPLGNQMEFFTDSPLVVSIADRNPDGTPGKKYLSPMDENYHQYLLANLQRKYTVAHKAGLIEAPAAPPEIEYQLLSRHVKEKRIDLMRGQPGYTRVKGYKFRFRLKAPEAVLRLAMLAGMGEKNAMGFGALKRNFVPRFN